METSTPFLIVIAIFSVGLAGCADEEEHHFVLTVMSEAKHDFREFYMHDGQEAGSTGSPAGEWGRTSFGCPPHDNPDQFSTPSWIFTLRLEFFDGRLFAEGSYEVTCDFYTAWVHPDGDILWEFGDRKEEPPPWER